MWQPIRAQLCTWWRQLAGTNWITAMERSRPEMDCGWRWIAAGNELSPAIVIKGWISSGGGSLLDMNRIRIWTDDWGGWQVMDLRRWIAWEGWQSFLFPYMKILWLCKVIPFSRSQLWFRTKKFPWNADMNVYDVPAAWPHQVRYRAIFRDTKLYTYKPKSQFQIRSPMRSPVTATMPIPHIMLQYKTSHQRCNNR